MRRSVSAKLFCALFAFSLLLIVTSQQHISADTPLDAAWQTANERGSFAYTTSIKQTVRPMPKLENVGRSSQTEFIYIEGTRESDELMQMRLWSEGGNAVLGQGALEVKVEDGESFGRTPQSDWKPIDDVTTLFAPGRDAFGFLHAATNITLKETNRNAAVPHEVYTFDLDGPAMAEEMRQQMQEEMRDNGELPFDLHLQAIPHFVDMTGDGELWISPDTGLPLRQIIRASFPPDEYEQADLVITTDFSQFGEPLSATGWLASSASAALTMPVIDAQEVGTTMLIMLTSLGFVTILLRTGRSPRVYRGISAVLIVQMVFGMLFAYRPVIAFHESQEAQRITHEAEQEQQRNQRWAQTGTAAAFDPNLSPYYQAEEALAPIRASTSGYTETLRLLEDIVEELPEYDDGTDTDGDGLTDVDEMLTQTDPADSDTDLDGLADGVEILRLGTDPRAEDTDGDLIPDKAEVVGFFYDGKQWYLDPTSADTNADGVFDGVECEYDETNGLACPDLDNDGKPNPFDIDNDGDGVPDEHDIATDTKVGSVTSGLTDQTFQFAINELAVDESVYVDFQLRPTNADHLWYTLNVLDWPSGDNAGQVQRYLDTTFYDHLAAEQSANADPQLKDGDLRLVPLLEIDIPFQNGHYGNLPVRAGAPPIDATTPISAWLDTAEMDSFGITVRKPDANEGRLVAYVPLSLVHDGDDNTPVAFSGRMFYRPNSSTFGSTQSARLVWLVEMLTDSCTPVPEGNDTERQVWCEDEANWTTDGASIVHVYEDEWLLTGMQVRENRGVEASIVFQDPLYTAALPDYTPGGFHDDVLWSLTQGLERTFLAGRAVDGERDLTIADISTRWDKTQNSSTTEEQRWNLPQDALIIEEYSFDHFSELMTIPMTHTKQILADHFTAQADSGGIQDPTLLMLREERFRSINTDATEQTTPISTNGLALTLDADVKEMVAAGINWGPYQYQGAGVWETYDIQAYWDDKGSDFEAAFAPIYEDASDVRGAVLIARAYYLNVYVGVNKVVEAADSPMTLPAELKDDAVRDYVTGPNQLAQTGFALDALMENFDVMMRFANTKFAIATRTVLSPVFALEQLITPGRQQMATSLVNRTYGVSSPGNTTSVEELSRGQLDKFFDPEVRSLKYAPSAIDNGFELLNEDLGASKGAKRAGLKALKAFGPTGAVSQAGALLGVAATIGQIAATAGDIDNIELNIVLSSVQTASALIGFASAVVAFAVYANTLQAPLTQTIKASLAMFEQGLFVFLFMLVVSVIVGVGLFIAQVLNQNLTVGSLGFNAAFANFVASLIVAILLLLLASIPLLGELIAGVIGLIDAIVSLVCQATGADTGSAGEFTRDYICVGLSGLMTKAVQFLLYDQTPVVDFNNENRINFTNFDLTLSDPQIGFRVGNSALVTLDVQSALYPDPYEFSEDGPLFLPYRYQFGDEFLKESTFRYQFLDAGGSATDTIGVAQMVDEWQSPPTDSWAADSHFVVSQTISTQPIALTDAGINIGLPGATMAEGYAVHVQECWTIPPILPLIVPIPICYLREEIDANNVNLGSQLKIDLFPETVADFMALSGRADGGYALNWMTNVAAPTLVDADGDGLRSPALGGNDPNDSLADTDGDTLSDFYEIKNGLDPLRADGDGDDLDDADERRYGTDPYSADTDHDGLTDGEEIEGWLFVYDYDSSNNPLQTRVWSDPLSANIDGDEYIDSQEKQFNFHPNVLSTDGTLGIDAQLTDTDAYYRANEQVNYSVTISNELDIPHIFGLLDTTIPSGLNGTPTDAAFALAPGESVNVADQLSVGAAAPSGVVSVTHTAGGITYDLSDDPLGRTLWVHFEENAGSSQFADSSIYNRPLTCSGVQCPVAGADGYQQNAPNFASNQRLTLDGVAQDYGFVNDSYTVRAWLKADTLVGSQPIIGTEDGVEPFFIGISNFNKPAFGMHSSLESSFTLSTDEWYQLAWRYDRSQNEYSIFVNDDNVLTETGVDFDYGQLRDAVLLLNRHGTDGGFDGRIDELEIFPYALADDAIVEQRGGGSELVFYTGFEVHPIPNDVPFLDDSDFQNEIGAATLPLLPPDNTVQPFPASGEDGFVGESYKFGGSDSDDVTLLAVKESDNLNFSRGVGAFSISVWVQMLPAEGGWILGNVLGSGDTGFPALRAVNDDVTIKFGKGTESCQLEADNVGFINDGSRWNHVAATFDGVDTNIYVNGVVVATLDCAGKRPSDATSFIIGNNKVTNSSKFDGRLDELRLYTAALSADEINDLFWDTQPMLELRFDEAPAQTLFDDRAVIPHDGSCAGATCPMSGVRGLSNQAVEFDGVDDVVTFAGADAETFGLDGDSFAVSAWVNLDAAGHEPVIGSVSADALMLGVRSDKPYFLINGEAMSASQSVTPGNWSHLVWRRQKEPSGSSRFTIHLNGAEVFSDTRSVTLAGSTTLQIGRDSVTSLNGLIDQVQIFRQALTDDQISELHDEMPVVNLHFSEATGATTFNNAVDNANHASCTVSDFCPTAGLQGRIGSGVLFRGDSQISLDTPRDLEAYSVGAWIRPSAKRPATQPIMLAGDFYKTFELFMNPNSMQVQAVNYGNGCTGIPTSGIASRIALRENQWNHVMMTVSEGQHRLYINGVFDTEVQINSANICEPSGINKIRLGATGAGGFVGEIDEFTFYRSELTAAAIADLQSYQAAWFQTRVDTPLVIDTDQPTVGISVTAPFLPDRDIVLAINAFDPTSPISTVLASPSNFGSFPTAATRDGDVWLFTYTPFTPPGGSLDGNALPIVLEAYDVAGNMVQTTQYVKFDGVPPVIGALNVESRGAAASSPAVTRNNANDSWDVALSGSVATAGSPTALVLVELFDDRGVSVSGALTPTLAGNTWTLDYPFDLRPNGDYSITVKATDGVGNSASRTVVATIDGVAPRARVEFPSRNMPGIDGLTTITGTITDTTGIEQVEVSLRPMGMNDRSPVQAYADGNILHLSLDDNTPGAARAGNMTFVDTSGLMQHATCSNCPNSAERGKLGNAVLFDGTDDYLTVPNITDHLTGNAYSFGGWVYLKGGSGEQAILAFKNADSVPSSALVYRHDINRFVYQDPGIGQQGANSTTAPEQWVHVWMTVAADNSAVLYINGEQLRVFSTVIRPAAGDALVIGRAWDGSDYRYLNGLLDDVAVYDRALTEEEVKRHYHGLAPVLYLPFEEGRVENAGQLDDQSPYENFLNSLHGSQEVRYSVNGNGEPLPIVGAGAYAFDGINDFVTVASKPHFNLSDGEFSQTAWVHVNTNSDGGKIIGGGDAGSLSRSSYPAINIQGDDVIVGFGDGVDFNSYRASNVLTLATWNHVTATFDGTTYSIYVNGELVDSQTFPGKRPTHLTSFYIAADDCNGNNCSRPFKGALDEIAMYRRVLSPEEIAAQYAQRWQPAQLSDSGDGVTIATWGYHVPANLKGSYDIQVRTHDVLADGGTGSFGSQGNVGWQGYINTTDSLIGAAGLPHEQFALWLRADEHAIRAGNQLQSWGDLSGNDNHALQSADSSQPIAIPNALNGQTVFRFDGSNDFLQIADDDTLDFGADDSFHIFAVMESDDSSSGAVLAKDAASGTPYWWTRHNSGKYRLWLEQADGADADKLSSDTVNTAQPHIILMQRDAVADELRIRFDGEAPQIAADTTTQTFVNDEDVRIGRFNNGSYALEADIAELIVVRGALSAAVEAIIHNYLSGRYNIPISDDFYAGDESSKGDYDFDITGLGAGNDEATSAEMQLEDGDSSRGLGGIINDAGDYVIVGHAGEANGISTSDLPGNSTQRWQRSWYLDVTEGGTAGGNLTIHFDIGSAGIANQWIPGDLSGEQLLFRPNLSSPFTVLATAASVDAGLVSFTLPNGSVSDGYYTLGTNNVVPTMVQTVEMTTSLPSSPAFILVLVLVPLTGLALLRSRRFWKQEFD